MPESVKAVARAMMVENAPKIFYVSFFYVLIITIMTELQHRLPGIRPAYEHYISQVAGGEPHSISMYLTHIMPAGAAAAAFIIMLGSIIRFGFVGYCLKKSRKLGGGCASIFYGFSMPIKVLQVTFISAALIALWSMLFFIPGAVAYYRYRQACYVLLDDPGKGALQCIRESKFLMSGNKLDLFLLDASFIGWYALSAALTLLMLLAAPFLLPAGMVWLYPYAGLARAKYYDAILRKAAA